MILLAGRGGGSRQGFLPSVSSLMIALRLVNSRTETATLDWVRRCIK